MLLRLLSLELLSCPVNCLDASHKSGVVLRSRVAQGLPFLWLKVAIGLLGLEVARQTRNDGIKKEKEAAYQRMLDERYKGEQQVRQDPLTSA